MKIKACNANTERYGYPEELEYNRPGFNGHQVGVALCVFNHKTKEIEENYLSATLGDKETRDFLLGELLHEKKAVLMTEDITQFDEEQKHLIPKTIYYMPYFVMDHSRFKPTVMNDNVSGACNVSYDIEAELLFVTNDGLCRYLTVPFKTRNISMFELVNDFLEYPSIEDLEVLGIKWQEETEEAEAGYALDFYSESGERFVLTFRNISDLKDLLASMRMIDIVCHIDGKEDDGDKSE